MPVVPEFPVPRLRATRLLIAMLAAGFAGCSESSGPVVHVSRAPDLPDALGFAGMAAGAPGPSVIAAGGANFPGKPPWEGGAKHFSKSVFALRDGVWRKAGELPRGLAYAAYAATPEGLVIAGGCDERECFADTFLLRVETEGVRLEPLPPLPTPVAFAACATYENRLFVIGGVASPDATVALDTVFALDLAHPSKGWARLPAPFSGGRMLATAGVSGGRLHVMGGVSLAPENGKPHRIYHAEVRAFSFADGVWRDEPSLPLPLAACPAPAPAFADGLLLAGGDAGEFAKTGKPPWEHPGQPRTLRLYRPATGECVVVGETAAGVVTAPTVVADGAILIVSGEAAPGVRTNVVSRLAPR